MAGARHAARVWRALTDRRALSQWRMETDFEPTLGHRFTFRAKPPPGWGLVSFMMKAGWKKKLRTSLDAVIAASPP